MRNEDPFWEKTSKTEVNTVTDFHSITMEWNNLLPKFSKTDKRLIEYCETCNNFISLVPPFLNCKCEEKIGEGFLAKYLIEEDGEINCRYYEKKNICE